jgi:hypothetical protein
MFLSLAVNRRTDRRILCAATADTAEALLSRGGLISVQVLNELDHRGDA